jgi:hypothetical protein
MDPSAAVDVSWIEAGLYERHAGKWGIGNIIPGGYPSYLRVMHPAQRERGEDMEDVSWSEVAAISGREVTALSSFDDLLPDHDIGVGSPSDDDVGERLCARLAAILQGHTGTPSQCTFLFGVYWGDYFFPEGEGMPTVELAGTRYSVAGGPCHRACGYRVYPAAWWPADRRWIVVTPSDGQSTLVGCDREAARELQADPAIEAWPVSREAWPVSPGDTLPRL